MISGEKCQKSSCKWSRWPWLFQWSFYVSRRRFLVNLSITREWSFFIEAARLWFLSDLANSSRPWEISNIWWTSVAEIFFSLFQGLCVLLFYSLNIKQGFIISLEAGKSQSFSGRLLRLKFCFFFLFSARVHFCPRWSGWLPDWQRLLGALLVNWLLLAL